jgi:hypothetical protein
MKTLTFTRSSYDGDDALPYLPEFTRWKNYAWRYGSAILLTVIFYAMQTWLAGATRTLGTLFIATIASGGIIGGYRTAVRISQKSRHFERAARAGDQITLSDDGIRVAYTKGALTLLWSAVTDIDHAPSAILLHTGHGTIPLPFADIPTEWTADDITKSIAEWRTAS